MRTLSAGLLLIAALVVAIAPGVRKSEIYTTHIGSRVPPTEACCIKAGELQREEGKPLKVFKCPI